MIELILGTYGVGCWLIFKKFRLVPITTYTVCTAVLGGLVMLFSLLIVLSICHPVSHDGRLYAVITQVVPQVRGRVIDVPVKADVPVRAGDVLFRLEATPYQLDVERLEAALAGTNTKVSQLDARLKSAEAATAAARATLLVSESDFDRQARIALEIAQSRITAVRARLTPAQENLARVLNLEKTGVFTSSEVEAVTAEVDGLQAELAQAQDAARSAEETLRSSSDRLKAIREEVNRTAAQELEARLARDAEVDGLNPEVRQATAELDRKRWELDQTTVRAPTDGFPTYIALRPGQMATPFSPTSAMLFVPDGERFLVATFAQNALGGIEPGLEAEVAFTAYPGRVFPVKVARVLNVTPEGQLIGNGQIQSATSAAAPNSIPVLFEYGADVAALKLPIGSKASVAIYTHHLHAIALVRKIILRIKSWENYAYFMQNFDALH